MFDIHIYLDAATLSIFGMFALWAAGSTWHWFCAHRRRRRGTALPVIPPGVRPGHTFGIEMLMVVAGLGWRRRRLEKRSRSLDEAANRILRGRSFRSRR